MAFHGLTFGVALTGATGREPLDNFCAALRRVLGIPVRGIGVWQYHRLIEAMDLGDVDIAWLPPVIALQAAASGRAVPIAMPVRGGASSYSTALFTAEKSLIADVDDLFNVSAAWVDRQSSSGYLLIRAHLRTLGIEPVRAFAKESFLGGHEAVVRAVVDGHADVGATFIYPDATGAPSRAGWGGARVRVLATAGPIPSDLVAASTRSDRDLVLAVQRALTNEEEPALRAAAFDLLRVDGFLIPSPEHLRPLAILLPSLEAPPLPPPTLPRRA